MTWRRREVILAVTAVLVAAGCFRLGVWQLDRRAERRARNAAIAARLALPPIDLDRVVPGVSAESLAGRRVVARGVYEYEREFLWRGRSFEGTPGVGLVTPLRLPTGRAVYVDRGWVPSPDASTVRPADQRAFQEPAPAAVSGIARVPPRGRADVVLPDTGVLPVVVQIDSPPPANRPRLPRRWPPPSLDSGPHLGYAIQWFSFGLIALVGTIILLRKSGRTQGLSP